MTNDDDDSTFSSLSGQSCNAMNDKESQPRPFQFSLWSLLVLTTLALGARAHPAVFYP
jgi:hypothetical protein